MSDLEQLVSFDMYICGFDPTDVKDINEYWRILLS
jgi:hypothetical protein